MKRYKAILLDWDDTIGDWTTAERKALRDIYDHYQLSELYPTFEDYFNAYKPYNNELWERYGRGEVTKEWLHLQRFLRPLVTVNGERLMMKGESPADLETLAHVMGDEFLRLTNKYFCLMPDAERVVRRLAEKYPLTIVSNGFGEVQYYKFDQSGLTECFTHILISDEVGINKPQPGIFELALKLNDITADEAVMIGDSYSSDIAGAKAAGIDQIWVKDERAKGRTGEAQTATYVVPKLTDVLNILLPAEERANTITHLVPFIATIGLAWPLMARAIKCQLAEPHFQIVGTALFVAGMLLMFGSSSLYHAVLNPVHKARLRVFDHISIYAMIAGSYSLICLSVIGGWVGWSLFGFLWGCVVAGIVGKSIALGKFPRLSLALYLAMGWVALLILWPMWTNMSHAAFAWVLAEGVFYTLGAYFFHHDEEHAFFHAVWHVFIVLGATCHTIATWLLLA